MNKHLVCLAVFVVLLVAPSFANDKGNLDHLIFPDPAEQISFVTAAGKSGELLVGQKLPPDSTLAKKIAEQLRLPFHRSMIKLSQCARNLCADTNGPNVLFLSQTEGGFPRQGLILEFGDRTENYPGLYYVDLVLDEQRVAQGELDIYSHELGHVMMLNIMGDEIPDSRSTKQHVSMGITDYSTAFFEGWGIHFQRLAYDSVPLYRETYQRAFDYSRGFARSWHSNIDQGLRIIGVLENIYIHRKLLPAVDLSGLDAEELILLEHTSPVFDKTGLKNAPQMLSCEGVLATLFHRINTNEVLQNLYRDKSFYERFLLQSFPSGIQPEDVFTPLENVFLKSFYVWDRIKERLTPETAIFIEFINEWGNSFPEDREEILKLFVMTTVGKTATESLGKTFETMSYHGMIGDYVRFRELASQFREEASVLVENLLSDDEKLDANLGPQIWITNQNFLIRTTLWNPQNKKSLSINLNTASAYDLASFPKIGLDKAKALIEKREELGYFKSLEQFKNLGFRFD
jgi:hypothetical protein